MNVLVDTCVWSLALRRKTVVEDKTVTQLRELVHESRVQLIGPIRQEILSGISTSEEFKTVREHLSAFKDQTLSEQDYELAAEIYNICRKKGIQGSNTDFLICAASINYKMTIYTTDRNFVLFKKYIPISLLT